MDLRKWLKIALSVASVKSHTKPYLNQVFFSLEKEAPRGCLELVGRGHAGPDPAIPAAATEQVDQYLGHNCPVNVWVCATTARKTDAETHQALSRRRTSSLVALALCHYAAHLSSHCPLCCKTVATSRAGRQYSPLRSTFFFPLRTWL